MERLLIKKPSTVFIDLPGKTFRVNLFCNLKGLYFFRLLDGNTKSIKVNIPHPGKYILSCGTVKSIKPIEIEPLECKLPEPDRQRMKPYVIIKNPLLTGSPARNFTHKGIIETGTRFYKMPYPLKVFILLHEVAHFYYKKEEHCDLWAAYQFIKMGYNNSTALYGLSRVLKPTDPNRNRILSLFKNLKK